MAPLQNISWSYVWGLFFGLSILYLRDILCVFIFKHNLKLENVTLPGLFFFLKITVALQDLLWFYTNFMIAFIFIFKIVIGTMIGIVLNSYNSKMALGSVRILTILILPVHEHELCFQ